MTSLLRWFATWIVIVFCMGVAIAARADEWSIDRVLIGLSVAVGSLVTFMLWSMDAASRATQFRHQGFHDDDPNWHYLTLSKWTALGYTLGVIFALFMMLLSILASSVIDGVARYSFSLGMGSFFLGLGAINLPTTLFAWFSEWRWNEDELQRRNPIIGLRSDRFDAIKSAGVWPFGGIIGIRFGDGSVARLHQEVPGLHGLYARLRRQLGSRFWGLSLELNNRLAAMGLDSQGRPFDETSR